MTLNNERKIIDDLQTTLTDAALGMNREKMENVVRKLVSGFKEYDTIPDKKFYALFDPRKVPADARVDFVYTPTYLACAVIICAVSEYEDLLEDEAIKETLYYGLNGCIGRKFLGAGYDDIDGFLDAMEIFAQCDVMSFIARFPEFNPLFNAAIKEAVTYLQDGLCSGKVKDPWNGESYEDKAKPILELLTNKENDRVNLFVYGTLMKGQNANSLLGDCEYKGKYILKNHAIEYLEFLNAKKQYHLVKELNLYYPIEELSKVVMIGPNNSFGSWIDEFRACFGDKQTLKAFNIHSKDYSTAIDKKRAVLFESGNKNLLLFNYEGIATYRKELKSIIDQNTLLVLDEIHKIKRYDGVMGSRAKEVYNVAANAAYIIALTGTPIPNSYVDIYNNFGYTEKFKLFIEQAKKLIGEGKSVIIWCIFIDSILHTALKLSASAGELEQ